MLSRVIELRARWTQQFGLHVQHLSDRVAENTIRRYDLAVTVPKLIPATVCARGQVTNKCPSFHLVTAPGLR